MAETLLITGSNGLIGSEMARFFGRLGWKVHGIDNNMRAFLFGAEADTRANLRTLSDELPSFTHHQADVRDRDAVPRIVASVMPSLVVHAAAQPSHDFAKEDPFLDFDINAAGTLNLLEACRKIVPSSPFVYLSTNKVYGDAPNRVACKELPTRFDYADPALRYGIDETCPIDASVHTLMGVSKLSGDMLVQEYGSYFGMPTVAFRCGCITGGAHAGVEQHGFLSYMAKALRESRVYRIFGYGGKQVRDNLHAYDVCAAAYAFWRSPRPGAAYNLGGGRENSVSVLEALDRFARLYRIRPRLEMFDEPRKGDHRCYISDTRKFRSDYPEWRVSRNLDDIFEELAGVSQAALAV